MTGAPRIWAVVPVKAPAAAKQRLAPLLEDIERERLARAMAEDVLGACMAARALAGTVVVTADDGVARLAEAAGASIVSEIGERGTNAAIQAGIGTALRVATGVVVVPADIPHVTAASLDTVAGLCSGKSALVLVPASRDGGTNLFACAPPDLVETSFGPGSFARHLEGAARAGLRPLLPSLGRLDLDLDRPEDIAAFLDLPTQTRTRRVLLDLEVPARLRSILAIRREAGRASPADTNMVL